MCCRVSDRLFGLETDVHARGPVSTHGDGEARRHYPDNGSVDYATSRALSLHARAGEHGCRRPHSCAEIDARRVVSTTCDSGEKGDYRALAFEYYEVLLNK